MALTEEPLSAVTDNRDDKRFELAVAGSIAFANYRIIDDKVVIHHTETPYALRGRGIGSQLVKGSLDLIRADGKKVVAGCSFVADFLRQNPAYADLQAAR